MTCSKINRILYSLYILAALSGCRCEDELPVPAKLSKVKRNWTEYWPTNVNKKWVFKVTKVVGMTVLNLEDDTLEFYKDTNILNQNTLFFKEYRFRKFPEEQKWIIGNYPFDSSILRLSLHDINYI